METKIHQSQALRQLALQYRTMRFIGFMGWLAFLAAIALVLTFSLVGCAGPVGPVGPSGAVGSNGTNGTNGTSCVVLQTLSGATLTCGDGSYAIISNGQDGLQGLAGEAGQNATPITAIQLCPNVAPVYPSVFPEAVLCVAGHLYGTYNGNTSYQYFAELPDGAYTSSGQGSVCSFSISGCQVTQ